MKRVASLLLSCLLFAGPGCMSPKQEPCPRCTFIDAHIKAAESFMPGYWVKQQTQGLEPVVDEKGEPVHTPEYLDHRRWLDVRDALDRAEGKVKDE